MTSVEELFGKLNELLQDEMHAAALPIIQKILEIEPDDVDALKCKVVALIHLRRFDEGLRVVETKPVLTKEVPFEKAYLLYRLNRHADALELLESAPKGTEEEKTRNDLLRAQVLYRLGRYVESGDVYAELEDEETDPAELAVNRCAALTGAGQAADAEKVVRAAGAMLGETADLAYNRACAALDKGDMQGALKALDEADELFQSEGDEQGMTPEEVADGRIVFQVQRAYVQQRLGQSDKALQGYEDALKDKPTDGEVAAVASNNLFALRGKDSNLFDSAKKAKALNLDESDEQKLTVHQRRVFALNRCLLKLYTNKVKECHATLEKLEKEFEGSELPSLVRAALLAREKKMDECTNLLQKHAKENPKTATLVQLTLAQIQLSQGDRGAAAKTLESIEGAFKLFGVVGSIVKLYESMKEPKGALGILEAAAQAADTSKKEGKAAHRKFTLLAADLSALDSDSGAAISSLEKIVNAGIKDQGIVARLVQACVLSDLEKAEKYSALLPAVESSGDIDVQELENFKRVAVTTTNADDVDIEVAKKAAEEKKLRDEKRRQRRMARRKKEKAMATLEDGTTVAVEAFRLPKKFEELVQMGSWGKPDPERWLPWHQRSYNRKLVKKRKGLGTASGGAQGGENKQQAAALDRSEKFQQQIKEEEAKQAAPAAEQAAGAAGGSSSSKKKKGKKK